MNPLAWFLERPYATQVLALLGVTLGCVLLHALAAALRGTPRIARPRLAFVPRALLFVSGALLVPLAGTAFWGVFAHGHLRGFALLVHVGLGGAFTVLLALAALAVGAAGRARGADGVRALSALATASFWLAVVAGFLTAGSIVAAAFPWLGTDELHAAVDLHRLAGLCLVCAALTLAHALRLQRRRRSGARGAPAEVREP